MPRLMDELKNGKIRDRIRGEQGRREPVKKALDRLRRGEPGARARSKIRRAQQRIQRRRDQLMGEGRWTDIYGREIESESVRDLVL